MEPKIIVAMLGPDPEMPGLYHSVPWVLLSTHPEYARGTRFDYGYLQAAADEGYEILLLQPPARR
jgi:hypothetical protein